jgi:hypothetical protein
MKEGKSSAKLNNNNNQQQQHQNGHLSPFKLAKLLDPEASWDKVLLSLSLSLSLSIQSLIFQCNPCTQTVHSYVI